ncbi:riboflavin biosynthesis protein RibD [Ruminococcaceae bacterium CPB6]|jgi:diaminohydroxyphosphoribosylaminopyrimidine deaminase/5-amino-6-(5-phosphoribosylamino)uracil reductase|uniref:Riboflavin biosynthesis protein RibD n=1 Tax=Caproicibacterium lactatifermentans TaxID=2666138 RepID=A0A859DQ76_9FIRM|nr:bifunctional diaminohydroxyphosphoribosylaminopyrimidine deaminase/5-amino-6-(5-phosphoribosylamino)uracil reductase RibD [Caproicibacterium lactatifermentans]ARP50535.1 riboflavin biosynthesis protein RibD [Ruminococcaceae bacterium CPB6]MDD4807822.1 bifunctional diaminohydroxyphosphoribosylaminopyrimidine deaminase/5-amino-6-(5-phosphoribosylamino)uracil reductase RibD [Oscillospiraceae bacterium]QKN23744.1 bifunctional diaminohydroxyphosphoribosylaminopyrimidine deaminase/5-amino-6-(5-phos
MTDEAYMRLALSLAKKGSGKVDPNPMVGAVIVKDGRIIGQGFHQKYGGLHAERNALADCTELASGATLYVTLEPCCHWGKTPPCTDAVIQNGIRRVVVGSPDPNPLVGGKGVRILREHGISVTEGVLREECNQLNEPFFYFIQHHVPYGILKYAMTMDGKIATATSLSKWITGEEAREQVHRDRNRYTVILVGVGTVLADDPLLTCRLPEGGQNPVRVICDTHLRTPLTAKVVTTAGQVPTLLATCCADTQRQEPYRKAGCEILQIPKKNSHVDLAQLMQELGRRKLDSVIVEGGAELNWSALQSGIIEKVQAYIAPKLFGGAAAKSPIGGTGAASPQDAVRLSPPTITRLGDDLLLESRVL